MQFRFKVLEVRERLRPAQRGQIFLCPGDWDDYSFKTSFNVILMDLNGNVVELGTVKIGYHRQLKGWTREKLPSDFEVLSDDFFSLGQDVEYYKQLYGSLDTETRQFVLRALRDVAYDEAVLAAALNESVFEDSLTRSVSLSTVRDQFKRVLNGQPALTDFRFSYEEQAGEGCAPVDLSFRVEAGSTPSTNVHVLIGRNGVGKTTLLNNMVRSLMDQTESAEVIGGGFYEQHYFSGKTRLRSNYFSSVVSVSFSAFDPFVPPGDRADRSRGPAFFYVGMKNRCAEKADAAAATHKTTEDLVNDFVFSFRSCLSQSSKKERWDKAIRRLESDFNFAAMSLRGLLQLGDEDAVRQARQLASHMSSGHSIVLLTITKLVDVVEEKTLVLMDEPESHLHPPLLSAFVRALSELLHDRNGVAIIATHSPVLLQEVPKSCVWKLTRIRAEGRSDRPERETFGENVGVLTREVFGLEVSKSGFHDLLERSVERGATFDQIMQSYGGQLGAEAQAILLTLIAARDSSSELVQ